MHNTSDDDHRSSTYSAPIIGYHRSALTQKFGIPRQPNLVKLPSYIEMVAPYNTPDAFSGIEDFSHLWITWQTHHNRQQQHFKPKVRPPRLGGNAKLGVFATRSTYRPSQMGLSVVKMIAIESIEEEVNLHISGADMLDGTPILDIKPYIAYSDAVSDAKSGFAHDKPALRWVEISESVNQKISKLVDFEVNYNFNYKINTGNSLSNDIHNKSELPPIKPIYDNYTNAVALDTLTHNDIDIICQLIAQDPRPAYRQDDTKRVYMMRYKNFDISFKMDDVGILWIIDINKLH